MKEAVTEGKLMPVSKAKCATGGIGVVPVVSVVQVRRLRMLCSRLARAAAPPSGVVSPIKLPMKQPPYYNGGS